MAVTADIETKRALADHLLGYLREEWQSLSRLAECWDEMNADEQVDFIVDWPSRTATLDRVREYAQEGVLSDAQWRRYQALERLVARQQPLLDHFMEE